MAFNVNFGPETREPGKTPYYAVDRAAGDASDPPPVASRNSPGDSYRWIAHVTNTPPLENHSVIRSWNRLDCDQALQRLRRPATCYEEYVCATEATIIGQCGLSEGVADLRKLFEKDLDIYKHVLVAGALAALGEAEGIDYLLAVIRTRTEKGSDHSIRNHALEQLVNSGYPGIFPVLVEVVERGYPGLLQTAVTGMVELGANDREKNFAAQERLRRVAGNKQLFDDERGLALRALHQLSNSIPDAQQEDLNMAIAADVSMDGGEKTCVADLTERDVIVIQGWIDRRRCNLSLTAIEVVGHSSRSPVAQEDLVRILNDGSRPVAVRIGAVESLAQFRDKKIPSRLEKTGGKKGAGLSLYDASIQSLRATRNNRNYPPSLRSAASTALKSF